MNRFNISILETFDSEPVTTTLDKWVKANLTGDSYLATIEQYRATGNKSLKQSLPLAIVGGVCKGGHSMAHLTNRTGWIAIDIDDREENQPFNAVRIRNEIAKISYIAFSALSVSGKGVWALIQVRNPEKQAEYHKQLVNDFNHLINKFPAIFENAQIDTTKGANPNDKRFLSYDPDAVIKAHWEIYDRLPMPRQTAKKKRFVSPADGRGRVESCIKQIATGRIDLAPDYEAYLSMGFAFADEYGESGREYFHAAVCHSEKYDESQADRQFTQCLQSNGQGITIASFFHLCKLHGIELKTDRTNTPCSGDRKPQAKYESHNSDNSVIAINDKGCPVSWDEITLSETDPEWDEYTRLALLDCDTKQEKEMIKRSIRVRRSATLINV